MKKVLFAVCLIGVLSIFGCSKKDNAGLDSASEKSGTNITQNEEGTEGGQVTEGGDQEAAGETEPSEPETVIIRDENFDFNANFEAALKASSGDLGKAGQTGQADASGDAEEIILPPDPVSNLKGTFNWKKNRIDLTWEEPTTPEFTQVEIRNNNSKDVVIVPKGKKSYRFTPKGKGDHKYIITTCDNRGLKGANVGCSVKEPYLFTGFEAPTVANTGKGKTITATISGINFDKYGIEEKDFKISCPSNFSVTSKSDIKRINSKTLSATMTIPKKSGNYAIVVSCGDVHFTGYFTVKDYAKVTIGTVMYKDGKAEAVIAGYNSLGYPFGVALKEEGSLKWAMEGSFGYENCFNSIVSEPDVVGVNSAENASFSGDIDGEDNWDIISRQDKKCRKSDGSLDMSFIKKNYPAFNYAIEYGKDWFIPSISELCQIYKNREKLNNSLKDVGGKVFKNEFYWSSTQNDYSNWNACAVKFLNGAIYKYYKKGNAVTVRCIKMYK